MVVGVYGSDKNFARGEVNKIDLIRITPTRNDIPDLDFYFEITKDQENSDKMSK